MIIDRVTEAMIRQLVNQRLELRLFTAVNDQTGVITDATGATPVPFPYALSDWEFSEGGIAIGRVAEFRFDGSARQKVAGSYFRDQRGDVFQLRSFKEPIDVGRRGDIIPVRPIIRLATSVG